MKEAIVKAQFLEKHLHRHVAADMSRYFNSTKGITCDKANIPGFLNGINKSATQQFDIDFDLGEWGFEYLNCFNETCRCYSHTSHAECIMIDDFRTVEQLTDEEKQIIAVRMQIYPEDVIDWINGDCGHGDFENLHTWLPCYDILKELGIILPFTYLDESKKPVTLQPSEIVERGWAKIKS